MSEELTPDTSGQDKGPREVPPAPTPVSDSVLYAGDVDAWFAALDRYRDVPFMENGREQPPMPPETDLFE